MMAFYRAVLMHGVSHRAMVTLLANGHDPRGFHMARRTGGNLSFVHLPATGDRHAA